MFDNSGKIIARSTVNPEIVAVKHEILGERNLYTITLEERGRKVTQKIAEVKEVWWNRVGEKAAELIDIFHGSLV